MSSEFYWIADGCLPDLPDFRDWIYTPADSTVLPNIKDLRALCSVIEDQGTIGSCASNATIGAIEILINKLGHTYEDLSRLFVYYNARTLDGSIANNNIAYGSTLRNNIKTCVDIGVCTEALWPYTTMLWNILPNCDAYTDAIRHRVTDYYRLDNNDNIEYALAEGNCVIFGIQLYTEFETIGSDGIVPDPITNSVALSGHAMTIVGYNKDTRYYTVRNSWGTSWGDNGYCYISYDYLHSQSWDLWIIKQYYGITVADPDPLPGTIPLIITPMPPSGSYGGEQLLTFFVNKIGDIRVSINCGPYFTYNNPIPIVESSEIEYYFKSEAEVSNRYYLSYKIDPVPLIITPTIPAGTYRQVILHFTSNIPCDIFILQPNDTLIKYDSLDPLVITTSRQVTYYGVSKATGTVYQTKTIAYDINPTYSSIAFISPEPGRHFGSIFVSLSAYEIGRLFYSINSESEVEYVEPFEITIDSTIAYRHEYGNITTVDYIIKPSSIVYRINNGDWIGYTGPFEASLYWTIEAAIRFEDGSLSDINNVAYTIVDGQKAWVIIG